MELVALALTFTAGVLFGALGVSLLRIANSSPDGNRGD